MDRSPQLLICVEDVDGGGVICRTPASAPVTHPGKLTLGTRGEPKSTAKQRLAGHARLSHSLFSFVPVAMRLCASSIRKHTRGRQRSFGALSLSGSEAFTRNLACSDLGKAS